MALETPPLERAQWRAAPATFPTARPWSVVAALIPFDVEVAGTTIVDVGAGGSNAVAALLDAGANAFAIDPRYRSWPALERECSAYFERHEALGRLPQAREASAKPIAQQRAAFRAFAASFHDPRHAGRYRAAVATNLPFPAESVDLVYSLDCITQYLDRRFELLTAAVEEALRVLRSGGRLVLAPFRDDVFALGYQPDRRANQQRLERWLDERGLAWSVDDLSPTGLTGSSRLVVRRAAPDP
jgi:SAM-dependent methyltransferase